MRYVNLGTTGVQVSELCLGTMTFGKEADRQTSWAIYRRCREAGINFFDCADVYSSGEAERILGDLITGERHQLIITTKVGGSMGAGPNREGLSRRHVLQACEESLHAFDMLVKQGKVRYIGVSNWAAWQVAQALGVSALKGLQPIRVIQPMYNLVKRQ